MDFLLKLLGVLGITFGFYAATWWFSHQMSWWVFALAATVGTFLYSLVTATFAVVSESTSNGGK